MMKSMTFLISAAVLALGFGCAIADTGSDARVAKLEETVRQLEQRVAALEGRVQGTAAATSVPADKANWRKLRNGMKAADVEQLLGSPTKVESNVAFTMWFYGSRSTYVQFNTDSHSVQGWSEP